MTENEKKTLNEFLSKTLKIDEEQLAELYNDAGELTTLKPAYDADSARMKQAADERSSQYKRGLKEGAEKIEKEIKSKYEVDSDLIGVELIESIVLSKIEEATKDKKDISKHPEMIRARSEWEKEQKARDKEWQAKLDAKDAEFTKARLSEKVRAKALMFLDEFNPVLPSDPRKAASWKETFVKDVLSHNFSEADDDFNVLDAEGMPMKDAHGYIKKFKDFNKEIADKYFEYVVADNRTSPGLTSKAGTTNGEFRPPATQEEYERRLKDINITPKERIQLVNFWNNRK